MKLTFVGTFDLDDIKTINDFLEMQTTTDREIESTTIELDGLEAKVIVGKWFENKPFDYNNTFIEKIMFRKEKR